jgi:tRNA pseudouridine55 synthase
VEQRLSLFGFLNCNKPPGMTSRDVVNVVQRRLRGEKVGHAGTLDPLAEGVLVVGVGPAVRLIPYVQQQAKHYIATFRIGASSISGDLEGEVTQHPELPIPNREQLESSAAGLVGRIEQTPPAHSAIWVDGKRAYKRIRAGEEFEMPKRTVEVYSLRIVQYRFPEVDLDIRCGSGTYIRSLGLDLARATGSTAVMSHLCRQGVGPFQYDDAVSVDRLRDDELESMLVDPIMGVANLPRLVIDEAESLRLGHGLCVSGDLEVENGTQRSEDSLNETSDAAAIDTTGALRAIVRRKKGDWCPYRVFPKRDES